MLQSLVSVTINGLTTYIKPTYSLLEACKYLGFHVPRFCYHELLSVAGNCRMCLIELQGAPKPVASCALPVTNGMVAFLDTPLVQKARENVLEFLLINHPLDCPICDQAGECDLQDQSREFGSDASRNFFNKRSVEDKYFSPVIDTIMTRCIHCTRCVRFCSEVIGIEALGTVLRGGHTEISNYSSKVLVSEISGNLIDLCPVGALTSRSYKFKARPWELRSIESVDASDSLGSNIYINYQNGNIARILPKYNDLINGSLLSDSARFFFDALNSQRLYKYFVQADVKNYSSSYLHSLSLSHLKNVCYSENQAVALIDESLELENLFLLKNLSYKYNLKAVSINKSAKRQNLYVMSSADLTFTTLNKHVFILATNLKIESAILNAKLRSKFMTKNVEVCNLSLSNAFTCNATHYVNLNALNLLTFLEGKHARISQKVSSFSFPYFIIGESLLRHRGLSYYNFVTLFKKLFPSLQLIYVRSAVNSEGRDFAHINHVSKKIMFTAAAAIAINIKETLQQYKILKAYTKPVFWIDTHGTSLIHLKASYLLPLLPYFFETNFYINLASRPQRAKSISFEAKLAAHYIKLKKLFKELIRNKLKFNFLNALYFLSLHSSKCEKFVYTFSNLNMFSSPSFLSLYPIKNYIEDSLFLSKFSYFSPSIANASIEARSQFSNFSGL